MPSMTDSSDQKTAPKLNSDREGLKSRTLTSRLNVASILLIVGVCLSGGFASLDNGFVSDDELLIVNNPLAQDFSHLSENLSRDFFYSSSASPMGYYRPLVKVLFMVEYQIFHDRPLGYHALSVLFFLIAGLFSYWLSLELDFRPINALLATLFFVASPVSAESVAVITSQSDLLVAIWIVGGFASYIRARKSGKLGWYLLALMAQILALLSKEIGVSLIVFIVLYEIEARKWNPLSLFKARWLYGFGAMIMGYGLLRLMLGVLPIHDAGGGLSFLSWTKRFGLFFLRPFFPLGWAPHLNTTPPQERFEFVFWIVLLVFIPLVFVGLLRINRRLRWGSLIVIIPLLFVLPSALVHVRRDADVVIISDRWLFLSTLGAGMIWAFLVETIRSRFAPLATPIVGLFVTLSVILLVLNTRLENKSHKSETSRRYFIGVSLHDRGKPFSLYEKGLVLASQAIKADRQRNYRMAASIYKQLRDLRSHDLSRYANYAIALYQLEQYESAYQQAFIAFYGRSPDGQIKIVKNDSFARNRPERAYLLGLILEKLNKPNTATRYFYWCLKHNPNHLGAIRALKRINRS